MIRVKRVYEPPSADDGARILVDRLWPRGLSKDSVKIEAWLKELSPSNELRRWFGHDPARWQAFKRRYRQELAESGGTAKLQELAQRSRRETVTLVFSSREETCNNARALKEFVDALSAGR